MVGTKTSGNPNIAQISKEKSTGPKTEVGKLRASLNAIKHTNTNATQLDQKGKESQVTKLMMEAGVDFSKAKAALEKRNLFVIWAKSRSTEELTEIKRLDSIIELLESDMSMRVMGKLEKGIPLNDADIKLVRLLKECLATSHELRFGKKSTHLHASYKDIRDLMFGDGK